VQAAFEKILLAVSVPEANEMVNRRKGVLGNYTRRGISIDLIAKFETAQALTDTAHQEGQGWHTLAEQVSALADMSAAKLIQKRRHAGRHHTPAQDSDEAHRCHPPR
jgi:hypothetical protein